MGLKVSDVLNQAGKPATSDYGVVTFNGAIGPDTDERCFRVYQQGANKGRYFILRVEDVVGDLHKWTDAELAHSQFVGQERYRIPVRHGAIAHTIRVRTFIVGAPRAKANRPLEDCPAVACGSDEDCSAGGNSNCTCEPIEHHAECGIWT